MVIYSHLDQSRKSKSPQSASLTHQRLSSVLWCISENGERKKCYYVLVVQRICYVSLDSKGPKKHERQQSCSHRHHPQCMNSQLMPAWLLTRSRSHRQKLRVLRPMLGQNFRATLRGEKWDFENKVTGSFHCKQLYGVMPYTHIECHVVNIKDLFRGFAHWAIGLR